MIGLPTYDRRQFVRLSLSTGAALFVSGCGSDSGSKSGSVPVISVTSIPEIPAASEPSAPPSLSPTPAPGQSPAPLSGVIVQAGDSIGYGTGAGDYAAIDHLALGSNVLIFNESVPGRTMATGYDNISGLLARYKPLSPSIFILQQGTNDLALGRDAVSLYRSLAAPFLATMRKAGFYTVLNTILPRLDSGWSAEKESERATYNALVRGNSAAADVINDVAADPFIGNANPGWLSYYPDRLHPGLAGQQRLAVIDAAILIPVLGRQARPPN
jgi:lysophospholipase L1-like esterase